MFKFIGFFALTTMVAANDLTVGANDTGRKIIDEERIASPAFWVQTANVTYNTSDSEVISRVVVTDCRPDKDGSAKIVEGGVGHQNVTIELKSPTLLRGYDFLIEVYAVPEDNQSITTEQPKLDVTTEEETLKIPISLSGDTLEDNLRRSRKTGDIESSTLNVLDLTTVLPTNPSTQAASDQSTQKARESEESKKEIDTPIDIGKDEKLASDVSTTPKIISPAVTLPIDANTYSDVNKSEATKDDQNKSEGKNSKPVLSASVIHEQFRNFRDSGVTVVEEVDYPTHTTTSSDNEASTRSSSIVETDVTIQQSSSEVVTSEALAGKQDVIGIPRVLISHGNDQTFKAPISYNN